MLPGISAPQQCAGNHLAADRDLKRDVGPLDRDASGESLAIGGQNDDRLMPQSGELDGQGAHTSASPPVLANGTASLAASRIFIPSRSRQSSAQDGAADVGVGAIPVTGRFAIRSRWSQPDIIISGGGVKANPHRC